MAGRTTSSLVSPTISSTPPAAAPASLISHSMATAMAMGVVTRAKKRRLEEEGRLALADRLSSLPDCVLGDIVSFLPTKAGARTQVLSSRWRHIWRSAPLNLDLDRHDPEWRITFDEIPRVLSAHPGPGRRFSIPEDYVQEVNRLDPRLHIPVDGWLGLPAMQNLQEIAINSIAFRPSWSLRPPPPASVHRMSSTLRVASFTGFSFPDGTSGKALHLPLLEQLTLSDVSISEGSLNAILAGCSLLQSLLLLDSCGFSRLEIVSGSLRSIGVRSTWRGIMLEELHVVDAPCLQKLLFFGRRKIDISVISAPRLEILGELFDKFPGVQFCTTILQGSTVESMATVVHSVKVLALTNLNLSLDVVVELLKCFSHLEKLYIKASSGPVENEGDHKDQKLIGTLDIRLRKIVVANYHGSNSSHVNFAKFFVSNAPVLVSMILESGVGSINQAWIAEQRRLLNIKKRASRGAKFNFTSPKAVVGSPDVLHAKQVHDLSMTDPFQRLY